MSLKLLAGAGSQLDSCPGGVVRCRYRSMEPSAFGTRPERLPTLERSMALLTMYPTTSVMVSDQKASFGGSWPTGKCRTYWCCPFSVRPVLSTVVVQYAASCTTLTAG